MRTLITEFKRMFFEKKIIWLVLITVIYVTVCSLFWNLRFKLDYGYGNGPFYKASGFKLWQETMDTSYMVFLMQIIPPMVYVLSFIEDRKNGIDNQICMRNHSNIYYMMKYITVIVGGMIYNLLSVILIYVPLYCLLSTGGDRWNYLDRSEAVVGKFFTGDTVVEFVLIIAVCYAFVGGVCAAMSYVLSMWMDNRVLVCIMPYIIFKILKEGLKQKTKLIRIMTGGIDHHMMSEEPFIQSVYYFALWILLLSVLLMISYKINIKNKK